MKYPNVPNRERFLAICHGERLGDVSLVDWFNRHLPETPGAFIKAPPKTLEILVPLTSIFSLTTCIF